jgi:hypothetical protein
VGNVYLSPLALAPVFGSALFFVTVAASCIVVQEKQEPETKKLGRFCPTPHHNPQLLVYPRRTEQTLARDWQVRSREIKPLW